MHFRAIRIATRIVFCWQATLWLTMRSRQQLENAGKCCHRRLIYVCMHSIRHFSFPKQRTKFVALFSADTEPAHACTCSIFSFPLRGCSSYGHLQLGNSAFGTAVPFTSQNIFPRFCWEVRGGFGSSNGSEKSQKLYHQLRSKGFYCEIGWEEQSHFNLGFREK